MPEPELDAAAVARAQDAEEQKRRLDQLRSPTMRQTLTSMQADPLA